MKIQSIDTKREHRTSTTLAVFARTTAITVSAATLQVKYTKCDGCSYHLLGIRDFTDIKSLAGANAVDAFAEGQDMREKSLRIQGSRFSDVGHKMSNR